MELAFRRILPDEVEKEVTQRDQFNSDEVELIEALIREAHQNSLDARAGADPVTTRIAFHIPAEEHRAFLAALFADLPAHLASCGIDTSTLAFSAPRFLVIEDFATTGLQGAWNRKDDQPFSDFWRRVGKSHKRGEKGGRWGLGKLVFSSASQARTFFGLTVRSDDPEKVALLMGQAVLATHEDGAGVLRDAHGFFCKRRNDGFQMPETDRAFIEQFSAAVGITRGSRPGLSIAIPFPRLDIRTEEMVGQLVRNYFFPVLMGHLTSQIGDTTIAADSFASLAMAHGGPQLRDGRFVDFIETLRTQMKGAPQLTLAPGWTENLGKAIRDTDLAALRASYARNELIHVRVPVTLKHRKRGTLNSHFDLFLRSTDGEGSALVVRGAITLPLEAREFRSRRAFGALIATDAHVVGFLGDAENPAHTRWNGNAERLNENWLAPATRLREIRSSLNAFADLLVQAIDRVEPDAFIDVLSIPGGDTGTSTQSRRKPVQNKPPVALPPAPARKFSIQGRRGGFAVRGTAALTAEELPLEIRVSAAYDLQRGNPLKKHSPLDFDFQKKNGVSLTAEGATVEVTSANSLRIVATGRDFAVEASGFDINRDLVVRAVR